MPTHVALLRGINLGPHKRVAMPALRTLVESLGHTDVATYIASGNVVFTASAETRPGDSDERPVENEPSSRPNRPHSPATWRRRSRPSWESPAASSS